MPQSPKQPTAEPVHAEIVSAAPATPIVVEPSSVTGDSGTSPVQPASRSRTRRRLAKIFSAGEWLFGAVSMIGILSLLATVPILQMLSLGYLLEVTGRVARSGRLRDGFVGIRKAARIGSLVAGTWLLLLPLRFVSEMWSTARLIDPQSSVTAGWRVGLQILTVIIVGHILWAWYRGGRFRHFIWPAPLRFVRRVKQGGMFADARDAIWDFVVGLRLPYYLWLGLRGFAGALAWLFFPITVLAIAAPMPVGVAVLLGFVGGLMLATVLLYLPFLQAQFAAENRFGAMFELRRVRQLFRRAPIAFWFALLITLLFAVPLYLLKIELTPREVAWLPSLVFVIFIFPARLLTGWALGRARHNELPRHFVFRWASRFAAVPVVALYALIVYFTRYLSWYGVYSLYEQHAFLVPVPFLEM